MVAVSPTTPIPWPISSQISTLEREVLHMFSSPNSNPMLGLHLFKGPKAALWYIHTCKGSIIIRLYWGMLWGGGGSPSGFHWVSMASLQNVLCFYEKSLSLIQDLSHVDIMDHGNLCVSILSALAELSSNHNTQRLLHSVYFPIRASAPVISHQSLFALIWRLRPLPHTMSFLFSVFSCYA